MPHKPAICTYCNKSMSIDRIPPTMTAYHGECRLAHLRTRWPSATTELERDIIKAEADVLWACLEKKEQ